LKNNNIASSAGIDGRETDFYSFFQSSPDLLFVISPEGLIIEANRTAEERLACLREELVGRSVISLHPAGMKEEAEMYLQEILEGKRNMCPLPLVTASGEVLYVETRISHGRWNGEEAIFAFCKDSSDRRNAEESAKKNEERYRILFENVQDIFYQADNEGRIIEISPSIERYSGYKPEELIGKEIEEVYLNPPDRQELMKILSVQEVVEDYIIRLRTKFGKEVFVSANIHRLTGPGGEPAGVEGSLRDVTGRIIAEEKLITSEKLLRKQNEEYYMLNEELRKRNEQILMINKELQQASDIFMNIRTGLHIYHLEDINDDRTLRMIGVNPAAERLTGIPAKDQLGNTLDENFPGLREKGIPAEYANVIRTKTSRLFDEMVYGDERVVESAFTLNAFPLPDNCVGISFDDITEQYKAREAIIESNRQLKESKEKAEESDRLKSAFLANMSHEIRTPMNGIMGFSMMLADPSLPKETRDSYVRIVNSSCEQLLHIVNDIIDISKIEAGQVDLTESSFDLEQLLNEVYSFYYAPALEKRILLEVEQLPSGMSEGRWIMSDRTKLRQIFDNLLSNAVKFTPSGRITLRSHLQDGFIHFEVEDTGIGIQPELQNAVFERFRQAETTFTKKYGGTGLGLSITKAYVERMGGDIRVTSTPGKGSVFSFELPYNPSSPGITTERMTLKSDLLKEDTTVLIVEDEEINRLYLNEILRTKVRTIHAVNGKEAIELVKSTPGIDVILMDLKLPDINGLELTRIIRSMNSNIRIIAQTAYALAGDREAVMEAGCTDYISKPVNREKLLSLISAHNGKSR
jgi:PAS domain S-box-containing protein